MKEKEIVSLEVAKALFKTEFTEWCELSYIRGSQITDYAIEKYGELTDDGYYELTKQGGGTEPWNNIYDPNYRLTRYHGTNGWFKSDKIRAYAAPSVYEVQAWLRDEKNIYVAPQLTENEQLIFVIWNMSTGEKINSRKKFSINEFYMCFDACLKKALSMINNKK